MATTRKDLRGRTLRKGEMQRSSDKRYTYSYTDPLGPRTRWGGANTSTQMTL